MHECTSKCMREYVHERLDERGVVQVRIEGQPLNSVLGIKSRFVGNGGEECSVEELALQYYAAQAGGAWTGKLAPFTCFLHPPMHSCFFLLIC